ncbi:uncharacterized protein EAF02_001700 [Botrytis sinoallii]|uniref:uncharacterized protein n=1 Tax=Botrytis sinoallii TaxID=1463999 RepID=UPI0019023D2F|nr:uncharacterized protein EAF02_001700 [Botrytis sinoallii]KAF7891375.1 hypothetical protein EAF02_001700 [Botrytis sinoallii]
MSLPSRNSPTIKALIEKQNAINFPQTNDVVFKLFKTWLYKLDLGDADEEIAQWKARKVKTGEEAQKADEGSLIDLDTSKGKGNTKKIRDSQKNEILEMIGGDLNATSNVALTNFCYPHMANLLDLYLFADMAKFTKATGYIMTPWLSYMWKYTTKGMLIRKFLLDLLTWEMPPLLFETNSKDFPEELRLELLVNMGYVIQVARHGTTALEKSNPLNEMSSYFEEVEKSDA